MVQRHRPGQGLSILNENPKFIEGPTLLHELVPLSSDAPAIEFLENGFKRRKFSYQRLHALSDILAKRIIELTEALENASVIIPILLPQCPELYIVLLAILKAGKAFCPLNLDIPEERLRFILSDISAGLLITNTGLMDRVHSAKEVQTVCVDHELLIVDETNIIALPYINTTDLAYVLYTSGSTGVPKAVSISHRAATQSVLAHDRHIPNFARFLQFAAPTFDVSIFEIFFPWFRGRTLVGCSRAQMLEDLPGTIKTLEADAAELTPTVVGNLLQGRASVPGLKLLLTIGEMLTQHIVAEYGGSDTQNGILWAMYGPTEAAIHCTVQSEYSASFSTGNIGNPLDTVSTFIIASSQDTAKIPLLTILPWGSEGELVLGGHQIAEEYLNRPELTASSFIDHPEYGRLYRTGDRARFHDDGTIECLGRIVAGQVKLRGQRIELGEVEQIIMKVKGCRTAIATIINDTLVAFCAPGSRTVSRTEVLQVCKRWLPSFMVPSDILILPSMPQLPSGKIDKRSLESEYSKSFQQHNSIGLQPSDHAALNILHVIQGCLGHQLSLDSNLAAAGLDSLRAIRVASKLRVEGYNLHVVDILSAQTPSSLITACKNIAPLDGYSHPTVEESTHDVEEVLPGLASVKSEIEYITLCTPLQEAMLFETLSRPSAYCNWVELELSVTRTYDEISAAITSLAQENDILRSGFYSPSSDVASFMQVTWKDLHINQMKRVTEFQKSYELRSVEALLRPFKVLIQDDLNHPRILMQLHHALYDGWSFDILLKDLNKLLRGSRPIQRPQFRGVSQYHIQRQQTSAPQVDTSYWADLLHDYIPTNLANYNGETKTFAGLRSYRRRSSVNLKHLSEYSHHLAISPQVFFQVATGYILGLYTGSMDVVFGNVTSGRTIPVAGIEDVVGPCIASLPCRLRLEDLHSVHGVLEKTQALNRDSLRHCALPLRDIAKAANVPPGTRLFDVLFVWQQSLGFNDNSSHIAKVIDSADDLEFKLTLEFEPNDDCISFRATFDPSIIPEKQIRYLSQQIDEVVEKFLDDIHCTMADVGRCFTPSSLSIVNPTSLQSYDNVNLSHAVETWAVTTPGKEAIVFGYVSDGTMKVKDTITYSLLNGRANQLARLLLHHGVKQDELVCIMMEKSLDLYVAILAVLKLGSGYLPLVPDTPVERVGTILKDAQITICISESTSLKYLRESFSGTVICLDLTDLSSFTNSNLDLPYNGSHIAYAVFTSGSTGTPKGVLVTQRNLMSNLEFLSGLYPASPESRMLQSCSQAFDVSVFEIFYAWHVGMTLCTARKEDLFRDFEASINALGATHLSLTPTVAALVNPDNVPRVKFLVTAGEALTEHVRRQWAGRGLYQGYGPSETTNICTVRPSVSTTDLINNIGAPFANTSAFVLDPNSDAILPRGAIGELCFGGEQVFRGYLNRPELNATKLISIAPYGRIYRSGDMGRLLPDDCILSTGRSDDQVKIRGQRVELGEITSIVLDNDAVADCVTLLLSSKNGFETLVTFWVPRNHKSGGFEILDVKPLRPTILQVFSALSRHLPVYMVPSYLLPISRIPMTAQAKIDKRLLQKSLVSLSDKELTQSAPSHKIDVKTNGENNGDSSALSNWEQAVAEILAQTLRVQVADVQRSSSFLNLGLDSVSTIRFCNALRRDNLGDFTVTEVLKNPTISYLNAIRAGHDTTPKTPKPSLGRPQDIFTENQKSHVYSAFSESDLQVEKINPCTPLQEAMLASGASSKASYNNTMIFDIKGDIDRLQISWRHAQRRHEILRTSFVSTEHQTYAFAQVVLKDVELVWGQVDTLQDIESHMATVVSELLTSYRPPLSLAVYKTELSTKLIFSCHHAIYDGIAIETLLRQVQQAYFEHEVPPAVSYNTYLQHMISQDLTETDKFWSSRFAEFQPTYFPDLTGKTNKHIEASSSTRQKLQVSLSMVRAVSQEASVSVLSIVQAAWVKLLHFYTGENDICFGNVVSGRSLPEDYLDQLVAPCFNTLPVRVKFDFLKSNSELVQLLHAFNVESLAHQLTALRRIQNTVLKDGSRLFDTLVILQQPSKPLDDTLWTLEEDLGKMDLPVVCEVHQDDQKDVLTLTLHHNVKLLSDEDAQVVAATFDSNLSTLVRHLEAAADDSSGFSSNLRAESNMNFTRLSSDSDLLHNAFERNASSLRADTIALDFLHADGRRTTWSYETLNLIANHVAHRLIRHGIGVEDIVPVHIVKSPIFYAGILGVLKAGAAFAPVHPDLPNARKEMMFNELNAKTVLCTAASSDITKQTSAVILDIGDLEKVYLNACETPEIKSLTGSNLAYCLYTSGSTGVPKAVSMEHRSPIQTIESSRSLVSFDSASRLLQYAAITFDMCYYDCFLAWTLGFTLCASEQESMFDNLPKVINSLDVTLLDLTPSVAASLSRYQVPGVLWLYCIGESMSTSVAREWSGACVNSYGPTEAAFCTTIFPVSEGVKTSVIGRPYPTTSFAVFSTQGECPLPIFAVGELYIGGSQLARGYLGRSALTDERFLTKCGQRFYRSGDVVRMLSNGDFEFIGRSDDQVKIRGLRVELGEINHVLQSYDKRFKSVTTQILKKSAGSKEQLVAFLVAGNEIKQSEHAEVQKKIMQFGKSRLPAYMVPQFYFFVDKIPKSMAGKVDKKALAEIFEATTTTTANGLRNGLVKNHRWNDAELYIRKVFSQLSKTPINDISPETSIYQLGLDSISAVQIGTALQKGGYKASASDVMKFTNCVDLAEYLGKNSVTDLPHIKHFDFKRFELKHRATVLETCGLDDHYVEAIRPCTPLQQGILSQFLEKGGSVYYNSLRLRLHSSGVDKNALKNAWRRVMRGHPILRTGFTQIKDEQYSFAMIQYKSDVFPLPWVEESNCESQSAKERLAHLQLKALTRLHLPMWEVQLISAGKDLFLDLSIFHALFDAHSLQLILNDVVAIYHGRSPGNTSSLEPVLAEMLQLSSTQNDQASKFWADLGKKSATTRFPNMAPLRHKSTLPAVLTKLSSMSISEVEDGCRAANFTLQAAGIASWSTILSEYTGESKVTTGVVLSGRISEEANGAVFPCINTVPFPCTITDNKAEIIESVMALNVELHQYQFTPLNKIQKLMGMPSGSLFDSLFAFQKTIGGGLQNELWTVSNEMAATEYPISIELGLGQEALEYRLTYLPHIIPSEQARLILDQLDQVMHSFICPESLNTAKSLLDQSLYSLTPAKEPTLPSKVRLLHEFVEYTANEHPDRIAFEFANSISGDQITSKKWTYRELDVEGNRVAHLLLSLDVRPGHLIGVCFEKCPEASFAMLGILKAGCAFVAIDPSAPSARQAFIIEDSGAQAVLSVNAQAAKFDRSVKVPVIDLDKTTTRDFSALRPELKRNVDPQDRSYCLYTSGTTGTPKGCELTHENAVQAMLAFQRLFAGHWDKNSRWLQFASFHFDVSVLEQYWSWSVGICVVSAPRDLIFEDIANSIRTLNITHIDLTPSLAQILHPDDAPSLCRGVFITGGESLKQEILDVWGPKSVIYNGYGPTEATIGCTMYPRVPANGKPSNIGPQFDNVGSYVLRPGSDIPVLRGGVGELCVSGKLVGKGYLNRPDLTKERFAHLARFDERVYRTGDLVRILHDGTFDFLGRADDQVKLRGQRLEIGEINSVIRQSNRDFTDVATLVLKHPNQQKEQLVAFVVISTKSARNPTVLLDEASRLAEAKEACYDKLSPYMVPTHFIPLSSMPLNSNHKADGKKLKQIYDELSSNDLQRLSVTSIELDDTLSPQEERIRHVLAEALNIRPEAVHNNSSFFELGMDSISVIGVSRALKQAGFTRATPTVLLRHSTVRRFVKTLSTSDLQTNNRSVLIAAQQSISATQHRHRRSVAQILGVELGDIEALASCTPLQQGMIARYLDSDDGLYFNTFLLQLNGADVSRLRWAWNAVFKDTQILRTSFINTDDGYVQAVIRGAPLFWSEHNVMNHTSMPACLQELRKNWLEANQVELTRPFELRLVTDSGTKILAVHIFHGLYDGNSIELMFEEVRRMYEGTNDEVPNVPTFHEALKYGPLQLPEGARKFWEGHLTGLAPVSIPSLTKEPTQTAVVVTRDLGVVPAYDTTRRRLNVTAQAIAQACWIHVLQQYTRVPITTGMIVSGRNVDLEHADRIIGPMFNTIPYQHHSHIGDSWATIISRVHEFNTAAIPYQHTPLRDIMKWRKRSSNQSLFDTLFVFQVAQTNEDRWRSNTAWTLLESGAVADYPLAFEVEQKGKDGFKLTLVTQGHISSTKTSNELLDLFEEALMNATTDSSTVLETLVGSNGNNSNSAVEKQHTTNDLDSKIGFDWNEVAVAMREEITSLADVEIIGVNESTSIFELGLDSIDAIKLSSRLKRRGINIPVSSIMRGLTIDKMVKNISSIGKKGSLPQGDREFALSKELLWRYVEQHGVDLSEVDRVLPLTPLQEAMVAEMIASEYTRYYNFDVAELAADTDIDRLRNSWHTVIESSPILRTAFIEVDDPEIHGSFAQIIKKKEESKSRLRTTVKKLDETGRPDFPAIFEDLRCAALVSKTLDPPLSITILVTPAGNYQVLSIAHALYDGWSLGLLHNAVDAAYRGQYIPPPCYEATLAEILSGTGPDAASFWQDYLRDLKPSFLPRRLADLGEETKEVCRMERASNKSLFDITTFAKNNKVSLQTLGQTVFALTLATYVGSLDVTYGCVLSGRDDDERLQLLFPTMNTVAIRIMLHGSRIEMLQYVQDNFSNIKHWQHYPLREATARVGAQGGLFDSLFIYQKSLEAELYHGKKLYNSIQGQSDVEYPVCVEMEVVSSELVWRCAVKEEVLNLDGADSLLERLDQVLQSIMEHPESPTFGSTSNGISICGLPVFKEANLHTKDSVDGNDNSYSSTSTPLSDTALIIRKALAVTSRVHEEDITRDTTIFHIGLDSISAIKVSSILRKQGIVLSVGDMLKASTIDKMAEVADKRTSSASHLDAIPNTVVQSASHGLEPEHILSKAGIESSRVDYLLPVTAGQLYMLSVWLNGKGANFYPEFIYDMESPVSFETLRSSWETLTWSNSILRTCIVPTAQNDHPYVQVVLKEVKASVTNITGQEEEIVVRNMDEVSMKQPWVHLFLSQTPTGWTIRLKIQHALYDGVSLPILMRQFRDLCNGAPPLAPENILEKYISIGQGPPPSLDRKSFWTKYLSGLETSYSGVRDNILGFRTEIFKPVLLQSSTLESTARQYGVSKQALFLVAYAKLHAARLGRADDRDVVIGVYLANRSLPIGDLATATVPTVNLLPLRIRKPFGTAVRDLATQIQNDLREISEPVNATTSLFDISEWTDVKVDIFVNFLTLPDSGDEDKTQGVSGVRIMQREEWQKVVSRIAPHHRENWVVPENMVNERVNAAYLRSIDIEVTVQDSTMSLGIFAPTEVLSLEDGETLAEGLRNGIERLTGA